MPFSAVRFARFLPSLYPLVRAFLSLPKCPLARAFLFRFERYFHKLSPLVPPHFCLFYTIRSFMSVPSDLILFHPARRFTALKQFSALCQSSDVSPVIHHFSFFSRNARPHDLSPRRKTTKSNSSLFEGVPPATRCAGSRQAERRRSGTAQP